MLLQDMNEHSEQSNYIGSSSVTKWLKILITLEWSIAKVSIQASLFEALTTIVILYKDG